MHTLYPPRLPLVDASSLFSRFATAALHGAAARFDLRVPKASIDNAVTAVRDCYLEHWRDFHDIRHPVHMLDLAHLLVDVARPFRFNVDWLALELMIIYHDAIMKLGREKGWNERESAKLAFGTLLSLGAPVDFCHLVAVGIRATAEHQLPRDCVVSRKSRNTIALLLDIDLGGIGRESAHFQANTEANWHEWQPVATRTEYDAGRAAWAGNFLDTRANVYHTPFFAQNEAQAKANLRRLAGR